MKSIQWLPLWFVITMLFAAGPLHVEAQTASTGALTGRVTDPSGGVIVGVTVKAANIATGQTRTMATNSNGSYQFSLLPPGNYSVHFEAAGFKSVDVPSITINVTETPTLNRTLEIGSPSVTVTVEVQAGTIQTAGVANGTVVGSQEITSLPLVTRNYTQILSLSPGVVTNVANAATVGNGTQDVNVNGSKANQNNYSMDGASIIPYTSGTAAQIGNFAGIAIPSPDTIQEFKVQTSQFDAGYGRNPGANVEVITKGGSNEFHGAIWEFNRNDFFNANDFFYKRSELNQSAPNKPQTLKQNTFGFTLGGPVRKNKIFFFGSYQGFRQLNGIGNNGFSTGYEPATVLMPWNDFADFATGDCSDLRCTDNIPAYRAYLGSVFGPAGPCPPFIDGFGLAPNNCNIGFVDGVTVANDGSNISNTAIAVLQSKGILKNGYNQGGFYFPGAPKGCGTLSYGCTTAISLPTRANENQYMANSDWIVSPKNVLSERYLYSSDPQVQSFLCINTPFSCNPGAPEDVTYLSHTATLRLTSTLTSQLINEGRITYQRNLQNAVDPNIVMSCDLPAGATIIPLVNNGQPCPAVASPFKEFNVIPIIDVAGVYSPSGYWGDGGNYAATGHNVLNTFQAADQVSWIHGIHTLRAGFDGEWVQYNNTIPAAGRGEIVFFNVADFLTSSSGFAIDGTARTVPATPYIGCGFLNASYCQGGVAGNFGLRGLLAHYNRINAFDWFVQDDIKVNKNLTINAGLRWEYDGWPSDKIGQYADIWASQLALVNTGSFFLNDAATTSCIPPGSPAGTDPIPVGTLAGFVVPKNFDPAAGLTGPCGSTGVKVNHNNTLIPGTPLDNFAPRLGVAWQPFGRRFVVRAGYGWFYDRVYSTFLVDGQLNLPPYSGPTSGAFPAYLEPTLHEPYAGVAGTPLTWTPRYLYLAGGDINTAAAQINNSALGYTSVSDEMAHRLPLTQEYSLDLQYDLGHGWVADVGYVGSHSIHVFNTGQILNVAHLVDCGVPSPTCNPPTFPQDRAMVVSSIPFNDPANPTPVRLNTGENIPARAPYLGIGGLSTTNTNGDALYNSLQAQLRHSFSRGLLLQASYTWSKELTDIDTSVSGNGVQEPGQVTNGSTDSNNPLAFGQQYGPAAFNRSQRLVVAYSYLFPWKSTEKFRGKVLGGWSVSGITTVQNGQPFTVTDGAGGTIYGTGTSRAILADPVHCRSNGVCKSGISPVTTGSTGARVVSGLTGGAGWINVNAFTPFTSITASSPYCIGGVQNPGGNPDAPCGAGPNPDFAPGSPYFGEGATFESAGTGWGNSAVGVMLGPGQFNWDLSVQKDTKVKAWGTLQFRAEFYNIWNHPQFSPPASTNIGDATFGVINSTSVTPRVIQFGLKFLF